MEFLKLWLVETIHFCVRLCGFSILVLVYIGINEVFKWLVK